MKKVDDIHIQNGHNIVGKKEWLNMPNHNR